jgi:hypothetical protein
MHDHHQIRIIASTACGEVSAVTISSPNIGRLGQHLAVLVHSRTAIANVARRLADTHNTLHEDCE